MKRIFCFLLMLSLSAQQDTTELYKEFIKSFVQHYDFSCEGRYTHEYHSFVLERTKASLQQLEKYVQQAGFSCPSRIVIMGYQKNGVASYYSSLYESALQDEASLSTKRGRVVPAHNIFGFLTGFLLKDAQWLQAHWHKNKPLFLEHTFSDQVELFDDAAYIFQKHAFGKDFETILKYRTRVEKSIKKGNNSAVLKELISFWMAAYQGQLKSCAQETLATQDILFSIDYAQHLVDSSIPVTMMHVGPDITYPIEQLSFQQQEVTESAQTFVKKFTASLQPINPGKKVAYIFCSFVDGVGKSTLLGNVINWVTHGQAIDRYQRVDNSSSQKGVLYPLTSDVFIFDLPAQLSHWISKPDGQVFVDAESITEAHAELSFLKLFIEKHAQELKKQFQHDMNAYKQGKRSADFKDTYFSNIETCQVKEPWILFTYEKWTGVFHESNCQNIRLLVPFEGVHSKGLKVAQTEQMLFTKGLLIPLQFEVFMFDVVNQLKQAGIEDLVFVDFLSMYPRSSRENIRVNFLIQQMKKLYQQRFKVEKSLYRSFLYHDIELCHLLASFKHEFIESLVLEAVTRASLYGLCTEKMSDTLTRASFEEVSKQLAEYNDAFLLAEHEYVYQLVAEKIEKELMLLMPQFFNRKYETFLRFSCEPLYAFSLFLEHLFGQSIDNAYFQELWHFTPETPFTTISSFSEACRDELTLGPLLPLIRSQWYALLSNLLDCQLQPDGSFVLEKPIACISPLLLKKGHQATAFLVQRKLPEQEDRPFMEDFQKIRLFNNFKEMFVAKEWGEFKGIAHCINWDNSDTYCGVYGYGYDWKQPEHILKLIQLLRDEKQNYGFQDAVIFSTELLQELQKAGIFRLKDGITSSQGQIKKIKVDSPQGKALALWVRAIATLEMIIKDPYSVVVTRKGSQSDFSATVHLLESVTLPRYFGIQLDTPLFQDYSLVQPVIPWELCS